MRIFIGLTDIANITFNYAKGFRALGHEVFSVVWSRSRFYPDSIYELVIDEREYGTGKARFALTYLNILRQMAKIFHGMKCDLFILYSPAVMPVHLYYPMLKVIRKKIVTAFWGSDIRHWFAFQEEMKELGGYEEMEPVVRYMKERPGGSYQDKIYTVYSAEKHSDLIISQPDCGQLQTRPYMRTNVPLDLSQYRFHVPGRINPMILHVPSVPEAKGSDVILKVVEELKEEGFQFNFQLIENMPNSELREFLSESDIVIDDLYSATIGGLSAEAMATGNAVLVRYMADYCKVPDGCPAINVNKFTLKDNLRQIILDVERRKKLAHLGRAYVENVNDHVKVCRELLDWLAHKDELDYDFHPTFYKSFRLPDQIMMEEKKEFGRKRFEFYKMLLKSGGIKKKQE